MRAAGAPPNHQAGGARGARAGRVRRDGPDEEYAMRLGGCAASERPTHRAPDCAVKASLLTPKPTASTPATYSASRPRGSRQHGAGVDPGLALRCVVSDEQQKEIQASLDALSNRKGVTLSPAERWELPQSSNQGARPRRGCCLRRKAARRRTPWRRLQLRCTLALGRPAWSDAAVQSTASFPRRWCLRASCCRLATPTARRPSTRLPTTRSQAGSRRSRRATAARPAASPSQRELRGWR